MAVHYCALCRRSSFCGRRHLYSAAHRRRLREALRRLQEEVAAARAAAAEQEKDGGGAGGAALPRYDPVEHERRVWCPCCGRGVRRDGRRGPLALPGAALLQHVCGPEHRREAARFWREQRAEAALRERCVLPAEEYERYAHALERAVAAHQRREEERIRQVRPGPGGPASPRPRLSRSLPADGSGHPGGRAQALNTLSLCLLGAKPPWLMEEEEEEKEHGSKQIGPSYEEFLKQKEKQKLKKLPPERVGANFDHTSQTSDAWLPSFGRVWNHGRRWQSRHQFRTESREKKKR
uniref:Uncharacterized protein n=1 Tax=Melopsittacus undulatus TaxID=13146 RepID=A0A8V5H728_MELUD